MDDIALIGYWNKSKENPDIVFNQPRLEDLHKYQLCVVKLQPIKEDAPIDTAVKKVNKELRNFVNSARRLK